MSVPSGRVQDQAELIGVINRLYGLGLPLLSVQILTAEAVLTPG